MNTSNSAQNTGKTVKELQAAVLKELLEADALKGILETAALKAPALKVGKLTEMVNKRGAPKEIEISAHDDGISTTTNDGEPIEKINVIKRKDVNYQLSDKSLGELRDNFVTLDFLKAANAKKKATGETAVQSLIKAADELGCAIKVVNGVLWAQKGETLAFPIIRSNAKFDAQSFKKDIMNSEYAYRVYKLDSKTKEKILEGDDTVKPSKLFKKEKYEREQKKKQHENEQQQPEEQQENEKQQPEEQKDFNSAVNFWKKQSIKKTNEQGPQNRKPVKTFGEVTNLKLSAINPNGMGMAPHEK